MASPIPSETELSIIRGDDYKRDFQILQSIDPDVPMDLTGYTIESQIRVEKNFNSTLIATFTITVTDAVNGRFAISLTDAQTSDITQDNGFYDIKLTDGTDFTETYIYGEVLFPYSVTEQS